MSVVIPGIVGLGSLPAVAAYGIYNKLDQTKLDTATAKNQQVKQDTDYFNANIGKVKNVDDLMKNQRLLNYVLTAYGASSYADSPGLIKRVLSEDPTNKNSTATKLGNASLTAMSNDLQLYKGNANRLNSSTVTQKIQVSGTPNQYFAVNKYGTDSTTFLGTYYTNNLNINVGSNGALTTTEGYSVMGVRLDNTGQPIKAVDKNGKPITYTDSNGNVRPDLEKGYSNTDLVPVNTGVLAYKKTSTSEVDFSALLNRDASVYQPGNYNLTDVSNDQDGKSHSVKFVITSDDNINYHVKAYNVVDPNNPTNGAVVYDQDISVTRDNTGKITKVATPDGKNTDGTAAGIGLDFGNGKTSTYKLDIANSTRDYQLSQNAAVYDSAGGLHNLALDYTKTGVDSATGLQNWSVKVWDSDSKQYVQSLAMQFDPATSKLATINGQPSGGYSAQNFTWSNGDQSSITFNFGDVKLSNTFYDISKTTDSVELGKLQSSHIDEQGNVYATYDKKNGGSYTIRLYKLAAANFGNSEVQDQSIFGAGYVTPRNPAQNGKFLAFGTGDYQRGKLSNVKETSTNDNVLANIQKKYIKSQENLALGGENIALFYAQTFKNNIQNASNFYDILGNSALRTVVTTVLDLPAQFANQSVETQYAALSRRLDLNKLKDPKFASQFVQKYLTQVDSQKKNATNSQSYLTGLLSSSNSSSDSSSGISTNLLV